MHRSKHQRRPATPIDCICDEAFVSPCCQHLHNCNVAAHARHLHCLFDAHVHRIRAPPSFNKGLDGVCVSLAAGKVQGRRTIPRLYGQRIAAAPTQQPLHLLPRPHYRTVVRGRPLVKVCRAEPATGHQKARPLAQPAAVRQQQRPLDPRVDGPFGPTRRGSPDNDPRNKGQHLPFPLTQVGPRQQSVPHPPRPVPPRKPKQEGGDGAVEALMLHV
mmetsp:Transcript_8331/g.20405  ORF Transcript_8331/g.20405 Transcript_8331/m.20405 type:complete len:216 (+) Transcript_8331:1040-1687(+)